MQSVHSLGRPQRRLLRIVGSGTTAMVATAALAAAAGAATTAPSNRPIPASGSVAALNASSMEVQNTNTGQTTVNWTSSTQFSKTATEAVSAVAAGDCVAITGTPSKKSKTTIAARTITAQAAGSNGSCTSAGNRITSGVGANGSPGSFRFGPGGNRPSFNGSGEGGAFQRQGPPSGSSKFRTQFASMAFASGKVKDVKGSTLTVSGISISPGQFPRGTTKSGSGSSSNPKSTKRPSAPKTETLTITSSKSTTVNATQSAAASDLAVGDCVTAIGPAASNGAVTATTVRITSTGGGSCATTAFGRFGGGGFGGGGFPGGGPGGPGGSATSGGGGA